MMGTDHLASKKNFGIFYPMIDMLQILPLDPVIIEEPPLTSL